MAKSADVEKLQSQINRGNMAQIALDASVSEYCARSTRNHLAQLIHSFRENKRPEEMISSVAMLAAIAEIEADLKGQVVQANVAAHHKGELENESQEPEQYREY